MRNVEELLKGWREDLNRADEVLGTDNETLNVEQFEILNELVLELSNAIQRDKNIIAGKWEVIGEPTPHNLKF